MSVWPSNSGAAPTLHSDEGALVSVSVSVEPKFLEDLLEALAHLQFPINPQIYHDAALRYVYADGSEKIVPTTLVDFPAYAAWLPEIRRTLEAYNFPADSLSVTGMLQEIHSGVSDEFALQSERYPRVFRQKHAHAMAAH